MKFTETNNNGKTQLNFEYNDPETGGGYTVFYKVPGNCKMSFIEQFGGLMTGTIEQRKRKIDEVLKRSNIIVYLNTPTEIYAEFIKEHYELYSFVKVPVGYGGTQDDPNYQYHIIIRNTLSQAANISYLRPAKKTEVINLKPNTQAQIEALLKKRRRKTDIAGDIVKIIQDNTEK